MRIRKLKYKDVTGMLEWMHDERIVHYLRRSFTEKTSKNCISFIAKAQEETDNIHLAIVDDNDEYFGTVSLKHIQNNIAEFGIALRACAIGNNYAIFGMKEIFKYGYRTRGINTVYWCVDPDNQRAIRFYEKHGYHRCNIPERVFGYTDEEKCRYIWYQVKREAVDDERTI